MTKKFKRPFTAMRDDIMSREDMSLYAKNIFCLIYRLCMRNGYCDASILYMAKKFFISHDTVERSISRLIELGLLMKSRRGFMKTNLIFLGVTALETYPQEDIDILYNKINKLNHKSEYADKIYKKEEKIQKNTTALKQLFSNKNKDVANMSDYAISVTKKQYIIHNTNTRKGSKIMHTEKIDHFERYWELSKRKENRLATESEFQQVCLETTGLDIILKLEAYNRQCEANKTEEKFIKTSLNWLKDRYFDKDYGKYEETPNAYPTSFHQGVHWIDSEGLVKKDQILGAMGFSDIKRALAA